MNSMIEESRHYYELGLNSNKRKSKT